MKLYSFFQLVTRDVSSRSFRFNLVCSLVNRFPGYSGALLRTSILSNYIGSIGANASFLGQVTIIHPSQLSIGKKVLFGNDIYIQASGRVDIGDYTIFGPTVKIWSINHIFNEPEVWIPEQGYEFKPVKIGKHVWVGANVFIMPGAEIGDGCIISAGSIVGAKKYPPYSIMAGNPARKIGMRAQPSEGNQLFPEGHIRPPKS